MSFMRIAIVVVGLVAAAGVAFWMRSARPPVPVPVVAEKARDVNEEREEIVTAVKTGYDSRDEIVARVLDLVPEEQQDQAKRDVEKRVDEELEAQRTREATWTSATDNDRLDLAFAALEKSGIVARQNFSDCGTCGVAEIADEMEEVHKSGKPVRGYVFFHDQDTEGALDGSFFMSYGARESGERAQLAIGREVAAALGKAGLTVAWNGKLEARIGVDGFTWKKRRFSKAPL
jgi:hypothetical protein